LMATGADLDVTNAGYYAIESLRLEKAYRAFGRELTPDYNPVEAGLTFACKLSGGIAFLGREAVEKAKADGPRRRLVSVVLDDPAVMMWGSELLLRDGEPAGQVMSAAWGETLNAAVGLAYLRDPAGAAVTAEFARAGTYAVNVGGQLVSATIGLRPPYDPAGAKIKGEGGNGLRASAPSPARTTSS